MAATPSAAPQDAGPHRRKPAVRATRPVEPLKVEPLVPSTWAENYVPSEDEKARQSWYEAKRAREKAHAAKPDSSPF